MMDKFRSKIIAALLVLVFLFLSSPAPEPLAAATLEYWVDLAYNSSTPGWGLTHFSSIQAAIDVADSGGTIHVACGEYIENVLIEKSITLSGADPQTTIINANRLDSCIRIYNVSHVRVEGFTLSGSKVGDSEYTYYAINAQNATHVTFQNCRVIDIAFSLENCNEWSIEGNYIDAHAPLTLDLCHSIVFNDNDVIARHPLGVALIRSHENTITNNRITSWPEGPA